MAHSNAEFELSALAAAKHDAESDAAAAKEEMMSQMLHGVLDSYCWLGFLYSLVRRIAFWA